MDESSLTTSNAAIPTFSAVQPTSITIAPAGKMMVSISYDGVLTYGEDYTPDAAASALWEATAHFFRGRLTTAREEGYRACRDECAEFMRSEKIRLDGKLVMVSKAAEVWEHKIRALQPPETGRTG